MAWTRYQLFLAGMMVVTGSINTLSTKWADKLQSKNSKGTVSYFIHPFFQACGMFTGEMLCLLAFKVLWIWKKRNQNELEDTVPLLRGNQNFNPLIFLPPAICDMTATSIMYLGLTLTYPASFQMLRGAVIVFTALLSTTVLRRIIKSHEWCGILFVIIGLAIVGLSDVIFRSGSAQQGTNDIITGDELIIMAQVVTAIQMVYEERFITKYNVPALQAVGWEGVFGFCTLTLLLIPMYFIPVGQPFSGNPRGVLEDALDAFIQLGNNGLLLFAFCGTVLSIAFFNFAGISVTKEISATTRMVLDSVRTLVIWIVSVAVLWQAFVWLQIIGFIVLIIGMCLYNDIIIMPFIRKHRRSHLSVPDLPTPAYDTEVPDDKAAI